MKAISTLALVAALLFAATPQAQAGKTEKAIIGGLIGGLIIGAALSDDDHRHSVVVSRGYGHGGCGFYDWVSVKTWVPGYYEVGFDDCGRRYRTWVSGHFTFGRDKVWIDGCHGGCGHSHGYSRSGGHRDHHRHYSSSGRYGHRR